MEESRSCFLNEKQSLPNHVKPTGDQQTIVEKEESKREDLKKTTVSLIDSINKRNLHKQSLVLDIKEEDPPVCSLNNSFQPSRFCRFCRRSDLEEALIIVCKCTGVKMFTHLDCLKRRL